VNITDDDAETPLYAVESVPIAQWLIDHGASVDCKNNEGVSPAQSLLEEFPEVSAFLAERSSIAVSVTAEGLASPEQPQRLGYVTDRSADALTSQLMTQINDVMERANQEGRDPEEELRQIVGSTVVEGMLRGVQLGEEEDQQTLQSMETPNRRTTPNSQYETPNIKRSRLED